MTLLEKATSLNSGKKSSKKLNPEMVELAVAFVNDDVSHGQVGKVLGISTGSVQSFISSNLRKGVRAALVKIWFTGNGKSIEGTREI